MDKLINISLLDAISGLKTKKFSSLELITAHLNEIKKQQHLNAFTFINEENATQSAKNIDKKIAAGTAGLLAGTPIAVKDLFCTKGVTSTACSNILADFKPEYESTVTSKLFAEDAIMIGKTNMDEFAMGSANLTSKYGPVLNPHKRNNDNSDLVPGGSSGGSAAAISANLCLGALGTDTGGSIRQPAAFCGNVGIKPSYGRCSRFGIIAFASSLDQAGIFAKNVADAAYLLKIICGYDSKDSTSAKIAVPDFSQNLNGDLRGKKIGIPKEYIAEGMPKEIENLWHKGAEYLKAAGAEIVDISLPHTKYALPVYYILAPAEASSNLARYDGVRYGLRVAPKGCTLDEMYELTRATGFGDEVKRRIMVGTYVLSSGYYDAYYKKAQCVRTLIANDFKEAYKKVDAILTPTTPSPAFALNEKMDSLTMYLNDVFTVPASLAGLPGISVPIGVSSNGLPLGLQILGSNFDENTVLNVAMAIEKAANYNLTPKGLI